MNIDLNAPIWAIDHLAEVLGMSVDRAREHTYSPGFPAPRAGFSRNLWLRDEVLAWFAGLPAADRSLPTRRKAATKRPATAASPIPVADPTVKGRAYKQRAAKKVSA
jgi:hypothetical protein